MILNDEEKLEIEIYLGILQKRIDKVLEETGKNPINFSLQIMYFQLIKEQEILSKILITNKAI